VVLEPTLGDFKICVILLIYMMLKLGHFGMWIRNTWKIVKCGGGEGWRRSVGHTLCELKEYYKESRRRRIPYKQ